MSITVNGATNTITAPSGLAIAGNTAVNGTLGVTGTLSATGNTALASGANSELTVGNAGSAAGTAITVLTGKTALTCAFTNATNTSYIEYGTGDKFKFYSPVEVTGTLSSTGNLTVGNGTATTSVIVDGDGGANAGAAFQFNKDGARTGLITHKSIAVGSGSTSSDMAFYVESGLAYAWYVAGANPLNLSTTALTLSTGVNLVMASGYVEGSEMTAPAAPAANGFRIFAEDNGAGKTRLMVQFATGAAQQIAIEP